MKQSILAIISAFVLFSCGGNKEKETIQEDTSKPVKVAKISREVMPIEEQYTATINAYDKVYLAPNIPGRIEDIKVEVNDNVTKGQRVVDMDNSQLVQMEVNFASLEKDMARMDTLIKYGSVSQQVYDQTKAQYDVSKASLENLRENTVLDAPFTGVVTGRYYDDKEIYGGSPNVDGKAAIVTIESIDKLKVELSISERYFPAITKGMKANLTTDIYPGEEFEGAVSLIYPTIEPSTRTFMIEVTVPNTDRRLRPGMFARVTVHLGEKEAVVVPASAVLTLNGTNTSYVYLEKNGKAKYVEVKLGRRFDDRLEIISDEINEGDMLVTTGQVNLSDGTEVEIQK